ncbi:putative membrane, Ku-domain protein [Bordetella holmesii 35009]|nr:putative membrane, Ku-domain protein [Bordetella holmesii 35009]
MLGGDDFACALIDALIADGASSRLSIQSKSSRAERMAACTATGICTKPKLIAPFQRVLAMSDSLAPAWVHHTRPVATRPESWCERAQRCAEQSDSGLKERVSVLSAGRRQEIRPLPIRQASVMLALR